MKSKLIITALGAMLLASCADTWDRVYEGGNPQKEGYEYLSDYAPLKDYVNRSEFPNFKFHLALDRPDPAADEAGVKYTPGFVHEVIYKTYLKDHESPEDIEYYMCGPGPMSNAVVKMLDSLGVDEESIMFDNFG